MCAENLLACVSLISWAWKNFVGMSKENFVVAYFFIGHGSLIMENFCWALDFWSWKNFCWTWNFLVMENLCWVCDVRSWKIFVGDVMLDHGNFFEQVILVMGFFEHVIFGCGKILIGAWIFGCGKFRWACNLWTSWWWVKLCFTKPQKPR